MTKRFTLDPRNGKLLGVCAGLARMTGIDATIIRVALVIGTVLGGFPWTLLAYGVAGWMGKTPALRDDAPYADRIGRTSTHEVRQSMRDIDHRLADVETYVTSQNSRLAREIEELR